jgi:hypothetical protein
VKRAETGLLIALGLAILLAYSVAACRPMRLISSTVSDGSVYVAGVLPILMAYAMIGLASSAARLKLSETRATAFVITYMVLAVASGCFHTISDSGVDGNTDATKALATLQGKR